MNKAVPIAWLCTVALGGFLAFSSNSQYFAWIIIPALWAVMAYKLMSAPGRRILIIESAVNVFVGLLLGLLFTRSGLMSGFGILCMVAMLLRMGFRVWRIYKIESIA